jgi:hypothetical protein
MRSGSIKSGHRHGGDAYGGDAFLLTWHSRRRGKHAQILLADAGLTEIGVTADHQDDLKPGPGSNVWTFHAVRPPE